MTNELTKAVKRLIGILFRIITVKIVYGLAILIMGSIIVIVCDWFVPTFNIYSPDSVVYIASIFAVYCVLDMLLLWKAKTTPAIILILLLASPLIILYAILGYTSILAFVESAPTNVKQYAFNKPPFHW